MTSTYRYSCEENRMDADLYQLSIEQGVTAIYQHHAEQDNEVVVFYSPMIRFGFIQHQGKKSS